MGGPAKTPGLLLPERRGKRGTGLQVLIALLLSLLLCNLLLKNAVDRVRPFDLNLSLIHI